MRMPSTLLWVNPPSNVGVEQDQLTFLDQFLRSFQVSVALSSVVIVAVIQYQRERVPIVLNVWLPTTIGLRFS